MNDDNSLNLKLKAQSLLFKQKALLLESKSSIPYLLVFKTFSTDGSNLSAIEFFKLCKVLRVYPVRTSMLLNYHEGYHFIRLLEEDSPEVS